MLTLETQDITASPNSSTNFANVWRPYLATQANGQLRLGFTQTLPAPSSRAASDDCYKDPSVPEQQKAIMLPAASRITAFTRTS